MTSILIRQKPIKVYNANLGDTQIGVECLFYDDEAQTFFVRTYVEE